MPKDKVETVKEVKVAKVKKVVVPKVEAKKARVSSGFSVPVYSLTTKEEGNLDLPKDIFGAEVNKNLLAQALRVYQSNQKSHLGHTKTRGEVRGSTRKIFRQKGTGRARHGSIMAPIFVGGGIALGPRSRKVSLELPKKMKKQALISALSQKMAEKLIFGLDGLDKATGKTKELVGLVGRVPGLESARKQRSSALLVIGDGSVNVVRAIRNVEGVDVYPASEINALEVISHKNLLVTKEAVQVLIKKFEGKKEE